MELVPSVEALQAAQPLLRVAGRELAAMSLLARAEALAHAARELCADTNELGRDLRRALRMTSGLSAPVIEHGLRSTLQCFEPAALLALCAGRGPSPQSKLCSCVLAGNVFSAAARPIILPLLCGHAALVKAASADDALPRALERAFSAIEPRLAAACAVTSFAHRDAALPRALLAGADVVSIYGSDATVETLGEHAPRAARVLAHGHGFGAIWIERAALADRMGARALAARAARDVAAYDQRGCLSPQAIFVQAGALVTPREFASLLATALAELEPVLPRGTLPDDAAAVQAQWRGVAAALFELSSSASAAVSYEHDQPLRASPGYRNVSVYGANDTIELRSRLAPFGSQLKALGVAALASAPELAKLAPYVCEVGAMQTPPLDARLDGMHPLEGF